MQYAVCSKCLLCLLPTALCLLIAREPVPHIAGGLAGGVGRVLGPFLGRRDGVRAGLDAAEPDAGFGPRLRAAPRLAASVNTGTGAAEIAAKLAFAANQRPGKRADAALEAGGGGEAEVQVDRPIDLGADQRA